MSDPRAPKHSAHARVTVEIQVDVGVWGGEANVSHLHKQAAGEAVRAVECVIQKEHNMHVLKVTVSSVESREVKP